MTISWEAVAYVIAAYLIGAIPFGFIIARQVKGIDIREHGSGNIGATNVNRVVGKKAGITTLVLDFLKGFFPVMGAKYLFPAAVDPMHLVPIFTALATVIGHSKPVYLGFKGGKSVITSLGAILAFSPVAALVDGIIAVSVIKITRYVSVGSIVGSLLMPVMLWLFHAPTSYVVTTGFMGLYVVYLHRSNIERLMKRQENRL